MKQIFWKRFVPKKLRAAAWIYFRAPYLLLHANLKEGWRFLNFNLYFKNKSSAKIRAIQILTHILEKGFSHANFRPFFGAGVVEELYESVGNCCVSSLQRQSDRIVVAAARNALAHYFNIHKDLPDALSRRPMTLLASRAQEYENYESCEKPMALLTTLTERNSKNDRMPVSNAILTRYSVRDFLPEKVPTQLIADAASIASKAPSNCNSQPTIIYHTSDKKTILDVAAVQLGCKTFAGNIPMLLLIGYDITRINGIHSRHQGFIDSSLFAMNLMLVLHEMQYGTCALNWAVLDDKERLFRKSFNIEPYHCITMFLAVGKPSSRALVPVSHRHDITDKLFELHSR
jgi:nitroreductase